jgi:hypothetical protein
MTSKTVRTLQQSTVAKKQLKIFWIIRSLEFCHELIGEIDRHFTGIIFCQGHQRTGFRFQDGIELIG